MQASSRWSLMIVGDDGLSQIVVERDRLVITPVDDPSSPAAAVAFRGVALRGDAAVAAVLAAEGCRSLRAGLVCSVGIGDWRCRARRGGGAWLECSSSTTSRRSAKSAGTLQVSNVHISSSGLRALDHLVTSARTTEPLIVEGSEPELLLRLREALSAGGER